MKLVGELWMLTPLPRELVPDSVMEASEEGTLLFSTEGHIYLGVTNPHRTDFKEWGVELV